MLWTDRTAGGLGFADEIASSPSQMKFVRKGIDLGAMFNDDRFSSDPVDITLEFMPGDGDERGPYFIYITPQKVHLMDLLVTIHCLIFKLCL